MVGYDDNNDALTLGDDDVLKVGDYELKYNSTSGDWEAVYTPTGDVANVPKNQSGSLFPTDFADALAGQALADDGNIYTSVQTAVDNASGWVFVGPGTFNENISSTKNGLTIEGSGYDTLIDGGTADAVSLQGTDCTLRNVRLTNTDDGGAQKGYNDKGINASGLTIRNIWVEGVSDNGIDTRSSADVVISNCRVANPGATAYAIDQSSIVSSCHSVGSDNGVDVNGDDSLVADNFLRTATRAVQVNANDNIIIGNRIINPSDTGVTIGSGADNLIANNRISDAPTTISDGGTGTTTDANLTGAAN